MAADEYLVRDESGDESAETVLEPARIAGLLSAITFPPLLVNVALPGVQGLYTSAILQVNSMDRRLLLDGLSPDEGHARIAPGSVMHVHAKLRGVQLDFATQVLEIQEDGLPPAYLARMPGSVRYHQRRRDFRVRTGHFTDYSVVALGPSTGHQKGRLVDLSLGGLKAIVPRDPGLQLNQIVPECHLSFLGEEPIECQLMFVHLRYLPATGELEAGARFAQPEAMDRARLRRCLSSMQRQHLRHRLPE